MLRVILFLIVYRNIYFCYIFIIIFLLWTYLLINLMTTLYIFLYYRCNKKETSRPHVSTSLLLWHVTPCLFSRARVALKSPVTCFSLTFKTNCESLQGFIYIFLLRKHGCYLISSFFSYFYYVR